MKLYGMSNNNEFIEYKSQQFKNEELVSYIGKVRHDHL